ncbi:hypothetical protein Hte_008851 [Hypoxylon texense]
MVNAAGAGPKPIPHRSLTELLVEAIRLCLTPAAQAAAHEIASKVKAEKGVRAAAASFYANLPADKLECDIIKGQPAAWVYRRKQTRLRLSKVAVEILTSHLRIDVRKLKKNETRKIIMETRRWDPITGSMSAAIGVSRDMAKAAADIVVKPAKTYRDRAKATSSESTANQPPQTLDLIARSPGLEGHPKRSKTRDCMTLTTSMSAASASGVTGFFKSCAGDLITIPYAFAEGFRNIPRLYGEEVRDFGIIADWKPGTAAGAKAVVYGVVDGVSDVFVLPYKGAQQEGTLGALKGVGKGVAGMSSKLFTAPPTAPLTDTYAATMGMATYPLQGIYKSVWASAKLNTQRSIAIARHAEGLYLATKARADGIDDQVVMDCFEAAIHNNLTSRRIGLPGTGKDGSTGV